MSLVKENTLKLTKKVVEKNYPLGKETLLHDSELRGFRCKITPKGKRVYLLYYRTKEGRQRQPVIGEHGIITCEEAREKAKRWLAEVLDGGDPSLDKQNLRRIATLEDFSAIVIERHISQMKPRSQVEEKRIWEKYLIPALGKQKLNVITRQDAQKLHHDMRNTPYMANRVLEVLRRAMNLAMEWGYLHNAENPCRFVKDYKEQARERFLSSEEVFLLGETLRYYESENTEMKSTLLALRLLMFTGCRRNEILELQWSWIDFEGGKIDFPDSKTGKKSIYLNPPTIELLQNAERMKGNPYVCIGRDGEKHLINLQKPWSRIRRRVECLRLIDMIATQEKWDTERVEAARRDSARDTAAFLTEYRSACKKLGIIIGDTSMETVRLHDLRHSFASVGAAGGLSLLMIGKLLGHKDQNTTQRYTHLLGDPLKEASYIIGSRIAAAMEGKQAEVIPLRK